MEPDAQPPAVVLARAPRAGGWWRFPRSWAEVRRLGWRAVAAFVAFYLVRDLLLYVLLPYLIYRGIAP
ncbi:MAG TPA: hypothetical protein VFV65_03520 [Gemmatimonadales bacterium]|nr:hypothetical protein [Gemmatimonadales bacterium]